MRVSPEKVNELGSGHLYLEALLEKTTSVFLLQGRPDAGELLNGVDVDTDSLMCAGRLHYLRMVPQTT